jgi:serine/threonine protein kinase
MAMLTDMLSAVAFMHHKKVMHRDLKLENWMLAVTGKVCAVAHACHVVNNEQCRTRSLKGCDVVVVLLCTL